MRHSLFVLFMAKRTRRWIIEKFLWANFFSTSQLFSHEHEYNIFVKNYSSFRLENLFRSMFYGCVRTSALSFDFSASIHEFSICFCSQLMWYQDSFLLDPTDRRSMDSRGDRHTLTIRNIQSSDFGNYIHEWALSIQMKESDFNDSWCTKPMENQVPGMIFIRNFSLLSLRFSTSFMRCDNPMKVYSIILMDGTHCTNIHCYLVENALVCGRDAIDWSHSNRLWSFILEEH